MVCVAYSAFSSGLHLCDNIVDSSFVKKGWVKIQNFGTFPGELMNSRWIWRVESVKKVNI